MIARASCSENDERENINIEQKQGKDLQLAGRGSGASVARRFAFGRSEDDENSAKRADRTRRGADRKGPRVTANPVHFSSFSCSLSRGRCAPRAARGSAHGRSALLALEISLLLRSASARCRWRAARASASPFACSQGARRRRKINKPNRTQSNAGQRSAPS